MPQPTTTSPSDPLRFAIPGKPVTSSRPRFAVIRGRAMAYHAKPYKEWLARAVDSIGVQSLAPQLTGPVSVEITVWVQRPKKTARSYPPYDLDNYAKGPLDALTKAGVWADDEQVVRLHVTKVYSDTEGIDIVIAPLALTII